MIIVEGDELNSEENKSLVDDINSLIHLGRREIAIMYQRLFKTIPPYLGLSFRQGFFVDTVPKYFFQAVFIYTVVGLCPEMVERTLEKVVIYDGFVEYEADRIRTLSRKDITSEWKNVN